MRTPVIELEALVNLATKKLLCQHVVYMTSPLPVLCGDDVHEVYRTSRE
jgi:hypothetical protein